MPSGLCLHQLLMFIDSFSTSVWFLSRSPLQIVQDTCNCLERTSFSGTPFSAPYNQFVANSCQETTFNKSSWFSPFWKHADDSFSKTDWLIRLTVNLFFCFEAVSSNSVYRLFVTLLVVKGGINCSDLYVSEKKALKRVVSIFIASKNYGIFNFRVEWVVFV